MHLKAQRKLGREPRNDRQGCGMSTPPRGHRGRGRGRKGPHAPEPLAEAHPQLPASPQFPGPSKEAQTRAQGGASTWDHAGVIQAHPSFWILQVGLCRPWSTRCTPASPSSLVQRLSSVREGLACSAELISLHRISVRPQSSSLWTGRLVTSHSRSWPVSGPRTHHGVGGRGPQPKRLKMKWGDSWLAQSEEHGTLDVGVVSSSLTLGIEITLKNKLKKRKATETRMGHLTQHVLQVLAHPQTRGWATALSAPSRAAQSARESSHLQSKTKPRKCWERAQHHRGTRRRGSRDRRATTLTVTQDQGHPNYMENPTWTGGRKASSCSQENDNR